MKRTLLFTGAPGAGKTTLCRLLLGLEGAVVKTQCAEFHGDCAVDLPGEFLTHPRMRMAYLASAQDASTVIYVQAADAEPPHVPSGLLQTTPGLELIGVVSKTDAPGANIERARQHLRDLGIVAPYFEISALQAQGITALRTELERRGLLPGLQGVVP